MAMPGDNYTGFSGLDLDLPANVKEFEIDPVLSPFRFWMTPLNEPVSANESTSEIESNDCFTAFSFKQASIGDYTFNVEGTDDLIWGANGENSFMEYHGNKTRSRFYIDWKAGTVTLWAAAEDDHDDHEGHDHGDHGNDTDHGDHGNDTDHSAGDTDSSTTSDSVSVHSFGFIAATMMALIGFEFLS
jgi:hypothetical protein